MEQAVNELFFKKRSSLKLRNIHRDIAIYNIAGLRPQHWRFPVNIAKFLRTTNLKNSCEWLLL